MTADVNIIAASIACAALGWILRELVARFISRADLDHDKITRLTTRVERLEKDVNEAHNKLREKQ